MRNVVILSAILAVVSVPAAAVQKCVALGSGTTCTTPALTAAPYGKADWNLTCTTDSTSFPVSGIAVCSVMKGSVSTPVSSLNVADCTAVGGCPSPGDPIICWCRMLSPAVSQWVFSETTYATEGACRYECAKDCMGQITNLQRVRTALFSTSTLSD